MAEFVNNSTLPEGDGHVFSEAWVTIDPQNHRHECECGFMSDIGAHEYEYIIDLMPTEFSVGYKHRECTVCHKKGPAIEIYYDEIAPAPDPEPDTTPDTNEPSDDGNSDIQQTDPEADYTTAIIIIAICAATAVVIFVFAAVLARLAKKDYLPGFGPKPISPWGHIGRSILRSIPVIGWIALLCDALGAKNRNVKNYARAFFCAAALAIILAAVLAGALVALDLASVIDVPALLEKAGVDSSVWPF